MVFNGDDDTRRMFESVWGSDAESRWRYEDAGFPGSWEDWKRYGGPKPASSSSGNSSSSKKSSGGSTDSGLSEADKKDGWVEAAGNSVKNAQMEDATERYGYDTSAATSRYLADLRYGPGGTERATDATNRYEIDTTARTAANQLAQEGDQFDATLAFKFKELENTRDRLAMDIGVAAANAWYQQQQVRLADQTHSLAMGQLGLDYVKTDTQLRSTPRSWAQLADFEAGARQQQGVPMFLQNLQNNVAGRPYGPMGGVPQSGSVANTAAALGGQPSMGGQLAPGVAQSAGMGQPGQPLGAVGQAQAAQGTLGWSGNQIAALNSIQDTFMAGPQKLSPSAWATLPTDQKEYFLGGVERLGGSSRSWQEGVAKARPGQGSTRAA